MNVNATFWVTCTATGCPCFLFFFLLFCFFAFSAWGDEDTSSLRRKQTLARNRNQSVLLGIFGGFFPKKVCIFLTRSSVKFIIKIKPTFLRIDSTTIQICEAFLLFVWLDLVHGLISGQPPLGEDGGTGHGEHDAGHTVFEHQHHHSYLQHTDHLQHNRSHTMNTWNHLKKGMFSRFYLTISPMVLG